MSLLHSVMYYRNRNNVYRNANLIRINECIDNIWFRIDDVTFRVVINGVSHIIYSSRKLPKLINRRIGCLVK